MDGKDQSRLNNDPQRRIHFQRLVKDLYEINLLSEAEAFQVFMFFITTNDINYLDLFFNRYMKKNKNFSYSRILDLVLEQDNFGIFFESIGNVIMNKRIGGIAINIRDLLNTAMNKEEVGVTDQIVAKRLLNELGKYAISES